MTSLAVESVGLLAPGLAGWAASRAVLTGERPYQPEPLPALSAALLPANERRRVTATIKLALQAAQEAMTQAALLDAGLSPKPRARRPCERYSRPPAGTARYWIKSARR